MKRKDETISIRLTEMPPVLRRLDEVRDAIVTMMSEGWDSFGASTQTAASDAVQFLDDVLAGPIVSTRADSTYAISVEKRARTIAGDLHVHGAIPGWAWRQAIHEMNVQLADSIVLDAGEATQILETVALFYGFLEVRQWKPAHEELLDAARLLLEIP